MEGYKYTSEAQAQQAVTSCSDYYGIPTGQVEEVTQRWCDYNFAELNNPQFWYIIYDASLLPILGEPSEFEVIQPKPDETN